MAERRNQNADLPRLDPLPKRLAIFAVLAALAVAAIWVIDARAMTHMRQMQQQYEANNKPAARLDESARDRPLARRIARHYLERELPSVARDSRISEVKSNEGEWVVIFTPTKRNQLGGGAQVHVDKRTEKVTKHWRYQ